MKMKMKMIVQHDAARSASDGESATRRRLLWMRKISTSLEKPTQTWSIGRRLRRVVSIT
jgi:hypothetical protein